MRSQEEWIEVREAARILTRRSGHEISPDYVRLLAHKHKIRYKPKDHRQNYYLKADIEAYTVHKRVKKGDNSHVTTTAVPKHE